MASFAETLDLRTGRSYGTRYMMLIAISRECNDRIRILALHLVLSGYTAEVDIPTKPQRASLSKIQSEGCTAQLN